MREFQSFAPATVAPYPDALDLKWEGPESWVRLSRAASTLGLRELLGRPLTSVLAALSNATVMGTLISFVRQGRQGRAVITFGEFLDLRPTAATRNVPASYVFDAIRDFVRTEHAATTLARLHEQRPKTRAEVERWARERHLADVLLWPATCAAQSSPTLRGAAQGLTNEGFTIGGLASSEEPPRLRLLPHVLAQLGLGAWLVLLGEDADRLPLGEAALEPPRDAPAGDAVGDALVGALSARCTSLRALARSRRKPISHFVVAVQDAPPLAVIATDIPVHRRGAATARPPSMPQAQRFTLRGPGLGARDAHRDYDSNEVILEEPFQAHSEHFLNAAVTLRLDPASPPLQGTCTCGAASLEGCVHELWALEALLHALRTEPESGLSKALRACYAEPAWKRLAATLSHSEAAERREPRLAWRLHVGPDGAITRARPVVQHRNSRGYSKGTQADPHDLLSRSPDYLRPEDRAALMIALTRLRVRAPEADPLLLGQIVTALVHHPLVFTDDAASVPLTVRRSELELRSTPSPDGSGYRFTPYLAGEPLPSTATFTLGRSAPGLAPWLHANVRAGTVHVVDVSPRLLVKLRALEQYGCAFPATATEALLETADALRAHVPVSLPPELRGEAVSPADTLVFRVTERPQQGLDATLRAEPLEGGPRYVPGEGLEEVYALAPSGARQYTQRALAAERTSALAVATELGLPTEWSTQADAPPPFSWGISDDGAALALLERLRERRTKLPHMSLEWKGDALRVRGKPSLGELKLEVRAQGDWFGVQGGIEVDGQLLSLSALLEAVRDERRFVRVGERVYTELDEVLRQRLSSLAAVVQGAPGEATASRSDRSGDEPLALGVAGALALSELSDEVGELEAAESWLEFHQRLADARALEPEVPGTLRADLRPYQRDGYRWLARLAAWSGGACLADDMGLGKTLQAIALLLHRAEEGPALIAAPTSVCFNWVAEAERFAPSLRLVRYSDVLKGAGGELPELGAGDALIVTHGLLARDIERFMGRRFATFIIDEAQGFKNGATRRAQAARQVDADFRLALSGTPLENRLADLWSIFRIIQPALLGTEEQFRRRFEGPIERQRHAPARRTLARTIQPFLLRRTKAEVAKELPERSELTIVVPLSQRERNLYEQARLAAIAKLAEPVRGEEQQRFRVLAAITKLRLIACHPRLQEPKFRGDSSKLTRLLELVDGLVAEDHRALLFSQFTRHLNLVREALDARGIAYQYLDGGTSPSERERRVKAFQSGEGQVFLLSLKAGGTGLNLTAADYVVHLDPWWNPAVEDQATDRAHRIGQHRPVTVYRLVAQGTIEEEILKLHESKRALVASVLDGADVAGRLSSDELLALLRSSVVEAPDETDETDSVGSQA